MHLLGKKNSTLSNYLSKGEDMKILSNTLHLVTLLSIFQITPIVAMLQPADGDEQAPLIQDASVQRRNIFGTLVDKITGSDKVNEKYAVACIIDAANTKPELFKDLVRTLCQENTLTNIENWPTNVSQWLNSQKLDKDEKTLHLVIDIFQIAHAAAGIEMRESKAKTCCIGFCSCFGDCLEASAPVAKKILTILFSAGIAAASGGVARSYQNPEQEYKAIWVRATRSTDVFDRVLLVCKEQNPDIERAVTNSLRMNNQVDPLYIIEILK
jgi:hypothetical protein